jgi:hypothetical protein
MDILHIASIGDQSVCVCVCVCVMVLMVTVQDTSGKEGHLEEKEYKYYIESDGPSGKKIVASFNMDISEYATLNGSR